MEPGTLCKYILRGVIRQIDHLPTKNNAGQSSLPHAETQDNLLTWGTARRPAIPARPEPRALLPLVCPWPRPDVPPTSTSRPSDIPRTSLVRLVPSRLFRTQWGPSRQCGQLTLFPLIYSLPHLRTRPPPTRMPVLTILYLQRSMHMLISKIHYLSHIRWGSEDPFGISHRLWCLQQIPKLK